MSAPLRWTAALAAVGVLGFAAGRYFGMTEESQPPSFTFPVVLPAGSAPSASTPVVAAQTSVPRTLHEILKLHGDFTQSAALYVLAANSDRKGIERLLDEAEAIDRESERRAAATILYQRYAELDPAAAIEHMKRRETGLDTNWLYAVFYGWARTDLDGALASASKLDDRARQTAGTAIVRSRDDLPDKEREALRSSMKLYFPVRDPSTLDLRNPRSAERQWRSALAIADRDARDAEIYSIVQAWAEQDPHAAIRAIEALHNRSDRQQFLQHAVQSWAQKNAREAVEWIFEQPPSHERTELLTGALSALVTKEPSAAMASIERLLPAERQQVVPNVLLNWGMHDPDAAIAWAEKHDDGQMHRSALSLIASTYAARDPEEALRWAETLPEEHSRSIMGQVIQQIAQRDPEWASSLLGQLGDGPERREAIASIAQTWAQYDPRTALSWVAKLSSSDVTPELYAALFGEWSAYDADAAVSQLNFMFDPECRNAAVLGILDHAHLEPDAYHDLFQRLEGADAKRRGAAIVYQRLRRIDPSSAERYRIQAEITDERSVGSIVVN